MFKDIIRYAFIAPFLYLGKDIKEYKKLGYLVEDAKIEADVAREKITKVYYGDKIGLSCFKVCEAFVEKKNNPDYEFSFSQERKCVFVDNCDKKYCPFYQKRQEYVQLVSKFRELLEVKKNFWLKKLEKFR